MPKSVKRRRKIEKREEERLRLIEEQERIAREVEEAKHRKEFEIIKTIKKVLVVNIDMKLV